MNISGTTDSNSPHTHKSWKPAGKQLMTHWSKNVDPQSPLPEYPRPNMKRDEWKSLNGLWEYAITSKKSEVPDKYDGTILVPYPIESALSGVAKNINSEERLWYSRKFKVPADWQDKEILLHFEAIDWEAEVWINGQKASSHRGGYSPFSINVTKYLVEEDKQELMVAVWDPTDKHTQPRGKQVVKPKGIWYTPTTGIWQTVWLEPVRKTYIENLKTIPDIEAGYLDLDIDISAIQANDMIKAIASDTKGKIVSETEFKADQKTKLKIDQPILWSPESPHLYNLSIDIIRDGKLIDHVDSYFGMRKISLGKDDKGVTRLMLNNKFIFQIGTLDQGFWPDGIYTAPTDEALKYDIEITKELGFNMLRKHVKVENRRFYYWCDTLGILVWQDMPSGDKYIRPDDEDTKRSKQSADQFEFELKKIIHYLYNHPSIIMWVPFNEGWGQYDTERIVEYIRTLDPNRLVNSASGWTDRGVGDVYDIHSYPEPKSPEPEEKRAAVLGEFGGLGFPVKGHLWKEGDVNWGYQRMTASEDLMNRYTDFLKTVYELKDNPGLSAAIYTQITDVEIETNGILTYDRAVIKGDISAFRKCNMNL